MESQYLELLSEVLSFGEDTHDRTGTGTKSVFGAHLRHDLRTGYPLLTTKRMPWKTILHELLWFLRGETNIEYLHKNGVTIWDEWANADGELGPVYPRQWRNWGGQHDQIKSVIKAIKNNPTSRRHIVSSWNVGELHSMALPPCHLLFQFHVGKLGLSCQVYQRSADLFLGLPFNIASYAALTMMVAQVCDLPAHELIFCVGDAHIYNNHITQVQTQLRRYPRELPKLLLDTGVRDIDDFTIDSFMISGYDPHPAIKGEVSV
jgi:thymidylate synthase